MTNERKHQVKEIDIAILGGGSCRFTNRISSFSHKKKILVFDTPEPLRNTASHGVHNFLGLDGLLPIDIRKIAWEQIDKYDSAELHK